jgi:hypothetical protein
LSASLARNDAVFGQMLAQINVMQEAAMGMVDAMTKALKTTNEKLDATIEEREAAIGLLVQQRFVMESKAHEFRMAEIDRQASLKTRNLALEMGPALLNSLAKKPFLPESVSDTGIVKMVLAAIKGVDAETQAKLLGQLPPHVLGTLMARGNQLLEQAKAEEEASAKAVKAAGQVILGPETPLSPPSGEGSANGQGSLQ